MAYTFLNSVKASGQYNLTTGAVDSTGADLIVIVDNAYQLAPTTPTDSQSNTWTKATEQIATNDYDTVIWFCQNPTTSATHTFTRNETNSYGSIHVYLFSGSASSPLDQTNGVQGSGSSPQGPGSVTPTEDDELLITNIVWSATNIASISADNGFTVQEETNYSGGNNFEGASAYLIQGTAATVDMDWSFTGSSGNLSICIATFKAGTVVAGSSLPFELIYQGRQHV